MGQGLREEDRQAAGEGGLRRLCGEERQTRAGAGPFQHQLQGQTYYFCEEKDKAEFISNPAKYAKK